jgi:hypothetical protein
MVDVVGTSDPRIVGNSPAVIEEYYSGNAIIYTNNNIFPKLTPFQQDFVIEHEIGHYILDTDSEIEADYYAFKKLVGSEYESLSKSIGAIVEILPAMNKSRPRRLMAMVENCLKWDYENGNDAACDEFLKIQQMNLSEFIRYFEKEYITQEIRKKWAATGKSWDDVIFGILTVGIYPLIKEKQAQNLERQRTEDALLKEQQAAAADAQSDNTMLSLGDQRNLIIIVIVLAVVAIIIFN